MSWLFSKTESRSGLDGLFLRIEELLIWLPAFQPYFGLEISELDLIPNIKKAFQNEEDFDVLMDSLYSYQNHSFQGLPNIQDLFPFEDFREKINSIDERVEIILLNEIETIKGFYPDKVKEIDWANIFKRNFERQITMVHITETMKNIEKIAPGDLKKKINLKEITRKFIEHFNLFWLRDKDIDWLLNKFFKSAPEEDKAYFQKYYDILLKLKLHM